MMDGMIYWKMQDIGQCNPAQGFISGAEQHIPVFPKSLHYAKTPAKSLFDKHFNGFRCFRHGNGIVFIFYNIIATKHADGQITVFGQGIGSKSTGFFNALFCGKRQWHPAQR